MTEEGSEPPPPSLPWRVGSTMVMTFIGSLSRFFMNGPNRQRVHGLEKFMDLLDDREDESARKRGLITVSNHICVIDDPLIWGCLPYRYHLYPSNHRWSLGSYDIVFTNKVFSLFFSLGQVLPTHRLQHSPHGGLFQPTVTEAIRLLSSPSYPPPPPPPPPSSLSPAIPASDPFTDPTHTYTTTGTDAFPRPSTYLSRRHSWVHIFPEGKIHQHPSHTMRYFKWGIARLILEADTCPDIIPVWIEGNDEVMREDRGFPRFLPRVGRKCGVWFGDNVRGEPFEELRDRWRRLVDSRRGKHNRPEKPAISDSEHTTAPSSSSSSDYDQPLGVLTDPYLTHGPEAIALREECTRLIRREVLRVRALTGLPDEDPKEGLVDTWRAEGGRDRSVGGGRMKDGSLIGDA